MNALSSALWAEGLKIRRTKVLLLISTGFTLAPLVDGLFMVIMKDPEKARNMGIIGTKAQIAAGSADWVTFFSVLMQAIAIGGALLFALAASWIFGREFSDHTIKDLLALPVSRGTILSAKYFLLFLWALGLSLVIFFLGLGIGFAVDIPGWSEILANQFFIQYLVTTGLTLGLMPPIAFIACSGRGYLPPMGFAILTLISAQIVAAIGWGEYFPWAVPALFSDSAGPHGTQIGLPGFLLVGIVFISGLSATYLWMNRSDQTR